MSSKTGNKGKTKKCLKTTLGTSKVCNINENIVDESHIRGPIHTSIFGLREVLSLFTTATDEVQRYVAHECDIMYECRMCRTIFRSLANFILHKRNYCTARYDLTNKLKQNSSCEEEIIRNEETSKSSPDSKSGESTSSNRKGTKSAKRKLSIVLNKLVDRHESEKITKDCLNDENSNDSPLCNQNVNNRDIRLEQIEGSQVGIFQTISRDKQEMEFMKSEVMEIHGILENNEAILGPDGRILQFETEKMKENKLIPKGNLICIVCNQKFATKKTLTYHIKYKHNETRLIYPCPECRDTFANVWCVFRHLYKIHRKTTVQIRKLRTHIHNSAIKQCQKPLPKQDALQLQEILRNKNNEDQNQQWLANFEGDNDLQMCGGCGKRFERKAALHSHSQMCMKRQAVCNSMKEKEKTTKKNQTNEEKSSTENGNTKNYTLRKLSSRRKQKNSKLITKYLANKLDEENEDSNKLYNTDDNIQRQDTYRHVINNYLDSFESMEDAKLNESESSEPQAIFKKTMEETSQSPKINEHDITSQELENSASMQVMLLSEEIDIKNIKIENSPKSSDVGDYINEESEVQSIKSEEFLDVPVDNKEEIGDTNLIFDSELETITTIEEIIGAQVSPSKTSPIPKHERDEIMNSDEAPIITEEIKFDENGTILDEAILESEENFDNKLDTLKAHKENRLLADTATHLEEITVIEEIIGARKLLLSPKTSPSNTQTSDTFEIKNKNLNDKPCSILRAEMGNSSSESQTSDFTGFEKKLKGDLEETLLDIEDFQFNSNITENDVKKCKKLIFIDLNNLTKRIQQDIKSKAKYLDSTINLQKKFIANQEKNDISTDTFDSFHQNRNLLIPAVEPPIADNYLKEVAIVNKTLQIDVDVEGERVSNITLDDVKNADNLVENVIFETSNFRERHNFETKKDVYEKRPFFVSPANEHNYSKLYCDVDEEIMENSDQDESGNLLQNFNDLNSFENALLKTANNDIVQQNTAEILCSIQRNEKVHSSHNLKKHMIKKIKTILKETINQNQIREIHYLGTNVSDKIEKVTLKSKATSFIDANNFSCLPCNKRYSSLIFLLEHMSKHFNWYHYQCCKCSYMSYNRNTCVAHAVTFHISQFQEVESIVLPIPIWKTIALSNEFAPLYVTDRENLQLDMLESIEEKDLSTTKNSDSSKHNETKLNTEENNTDIDSTVMKDCQQDPSVQKMIMQVIFGNDFTSKASVSKEESASIEDCSRPIRIRTKSIKTSQKDFLYEKELQNLCKKNKKSTDSKSEAKPRKMVSKSELKVYGKRRKTIDLFHSKSDCSNMTVPPKHVVGDDPV